MSPFPSSLDNLPESHADGTAEIIHASTINDLASAVNAVESAAQPVVNGITADVTAANLNALTGGGATSLHSHASGGVLRASTPVPLTDAQIKALPTTPIQLVAAPGGGKMILPQAAYLIADFAVAYSGIDANTNYPAIWVAHSHSPIYLTEFVDDVDRDILALTSFLTSTNTFGRVGWTLPPFIESRVSGAGPVVLALPDLAFFPGGTGAVDDWDDMSLKIGADNSIDFTGGDAVNTLKVVVTYLVLDTVSGGIVSA